MLCQGDCVYIHLHLFDYVILFSQVYASFVPVDSSLTLEQISEHLQQVIQSEVRNDTSDCDAAYQPLATAFSYLDAFDIIFEDDLDLAEHCQLTLESGLIVLQGASVRMVTIT